MAVVGSTLPTLADVMKRSDPNSSIARIVEMLEQTNPILTDAIWVEGNGTTAHRTTVRTGLPSVAWRMLNYGVPRSKSTTAQVDDSYGMLETYAEVDKDICMLASDPAAWRLSEETAFLEAMNQEMSTGIFYNNTAIDPKRFLGLAPRYPSLSGAANAANIIDAGGTGTDNASIWLIVWGENTVHMTYPKGKIAGLQNKDLGEHTLQDPAGGQFQGFRTHYKWDAGLVVRDWRYAVRIANIDMSNLRAGSAAADLVTMMIKALYQIPTIGMGTPVFYVPRAVAAMLDIQQLAKTNLALSLSDVQGKQVLNFRGIPIRTVDSLLETEARVV